MRKYAAALLISMAFVSPVMAQTAPPPRQNPICEIGRTTDPAAQRMVPGNEYPRPGKLLDLRRVVIQIVLRLAGCRVVATK
jgi:hypothetical protein